MCLFKRSAVFVLLTLRSSRSPPRAPTARAASESSISRYTRAPLAFATVLINKTNDLHSVLIFVHNSYIRVRHYIYKYRGRDFDSWCVRHLARDTLHGKSLIFPWNPSRLILYIYGLLVHLRSRVSSEAAYWNV